MRVKPAGVGLLVAFVFMLVINSLSQAKGPGFAKSNAELSDLSPTYLTPDGKTFGIWPIIYVLQAVGTFQDIQIRSNGIYTRIDEMRQSSLAAAFASNALWLILFTNEFYGLSFAVIAFYLAAIWRTYSLMFYPGQRKIPFALRVGVSVNMAWLCVATWINVLIASARYSTGTMPGQALTEPAGTQQAASIVVVALTGIAGVILYKNGDAAFSSAVAWALAGVCREQMAHDARDVAQTARVCSVVCALGAVGGICLHVQKAR
eukprot:TRINITY_DN13814_c0_g1_i2.p1 TRINITY_DN13814_c0_g1~~TRINITY_DN13814_c0_g1_i2.p1  ORF type:complete len:262 (-),score=36.96 TRINITY_DN13814_c0_g1_i2:110-895(-)